MKFRADINGLRAMAVAAVLCFHYKVPHFSGGFLGVDIFFVISGYLMTRIIITAIDNDAFSIADFYRQRIRRVIPALVVMIAIVTLYTFFRYFPADFRANQLNGTSSLLFLSNIYYLQSSDYFAPEASTNIFLHTWSLSLEWQFYLAYPFILLLLKRMIKTPQRFSQIFTGITFLSFAGSLLCTRFYPEASFYLLPSRAWEMLLGGIAFFGHDLIKTRWQKPIALIGYFVLVLTVLFYTNYLPWPGVYTLLPVLSTFAILLCNQNKFFFIKNQAVQLIGRISYSLYLWHWPVYVVARYEKRDLSNGTITVLVCVSLALAYLSYFFIEKPKSVKAFSLIYTSMGLAAVTCAFAFFNANKMNFSPVSARLATYEIDHQAEIDSQLRTGECFIKPDDRAAGFSKSSCLSIKEDKKNFLLIGDSHAAHLSAALQTKLGPANIHILQATAVGCLPLLRKNGNAPACNEIRSYIFDDFIVKNHAKIDGIILSASWANMPDQKSFEELYGNLQQTLTYLRRYQIKHLVLGQTEYYTTPYPVIKAREIEYGKKVTSEDYRTKPLLLNEFLSRKMDSGYVDIYTDVAEIPPLSNEGIPYMFDENHYTKYGAELIVEKILNDSTASRFFNEAAAIP